MRPSVQGASPIVEGAIEVESLRGERRLWLEDRDDYAVSNDGKRIALSGYGSVSIWSAEDGRLETRIPIKGGPINIGKIQWSSDDRALHLEDAQTGTLARTTAVIGVGGDDLGKLRFRGTSSATRPHFGALTVARRGSTTVVLSGSSSTSDEEPFRRRSGALMLVNGDACTQIGTASSTDIVSFSSDGGSLLISQWDDEGVALVSQRSADDGRLLDAARLARSDQAIVLPNIDRVMSFGEDSVKVFSWSRKVAIANVKAPEVASFPNGNRDFFHDANPDRPGGTNGVVYASRDGSFLLGESRAFKQSISIWTLKDMTRSRRVAIGRSIERIAVAPDETRFAIGATDGVVEVRRVRDGTKGLQIGHVAPITALAFSPDGKLIASGARDGVVQIVSTESGTRVGRLEVEADRASLITWTATDQLVIDTKFGQTITVSADLARIAEYRLDERMSDGTAE